MTFPRYPEYRDSGVEWLGEVPAHWEVRSVRRLLLGIEQGWSPECYARPAELDEWGVLKSGCTNRGRFEESENKALPIELEPVPELEVRSGDLLMSRASGSPSLVGSTALVGVTRSKLMLSDKVFRLRSSSDCSPSFIAWAFGSVPLRAQIQRAISGADGLANNLPQKALLEFRCSVPPMREQEAIAAFLDRETAKIDALVAEQQRLIELLKENRQAVISHAVTKGLNPDAPMKPSGVEWLGEVPAHWAVTQVRHLLTKIEQGWSPQCESEPVSSASEWGVLKVGCVNGGIFRPEENKALPTELAPMPQLGIRAGDLLVSRANTRELVGGAAVADRDYPNLLLCDKLYRLRMKGEADSRFVHRMLQSSGARGQIELAASGASASMVNISQEVIMGMVCVLPPLPEQVAIAAFLDRETAKIDALIAEAGRAIALLQERRTALISAAVTGQIDVRNQVDESRP